ncbi:hypothetical protein Pryu01_01254 [Paraliobacillus ryukyuensis]|uniref:Phage protein n=1 Tax=Paraliobacillus ryukyuensis TaxID=200904 RepID=A0A366EB15_9BACI|nr:hypothetical protein [Paraliobacillus ryukyuensis]RBO99512.1 hypothetical protein DES48_104188 [Paraliobacillus ryukyuensis]
MIKEALEYLVKLGNKDVVEVNGQAYATGSMNLLESPSARTIDVRSLSGLIDYLKSNFDELDNVLIQIESATSVVAYSTLNDDYNRQKWIRASALLPDFRFDSFYDSESFNIKLQSCFLDNDDRKIMLQVVGNIREEAVQTFGDDGVSQSVVARTGIAQVGDVKVPNPVMLSPYRTFVEIDQPESNFVFRMKEGAKCALFEADSGAWELEAMDNIKDHLMRELQDLIDSGDVHIIS